MTKISRRHVVLAGAAAACVATQSLAAEAIDETGFVRISGIDQWIAVQGTDRHHPAILYLHGGPGEAQSPFLDQFKPWLADFTVVNWDQRGAGKTYEKNGDATPDVTFDQIIEDAIALSEHLLMKLNKAKLILVGQSAGSMLGLKVAQRRPDLFYAFVGTAQVVSVIRSAEWQEKQIEVPKTHDAAEMKALHQWAIKSPPDQSYMNRLEEFMASPAGAVWLAGYHFEARKIGPAMEKFDAVNTVPDLALPYIAIQGSQDRITPVSVAQDYFDKVRSSGKVFVAIDGGHYACFTNPDSFVGALNKYVRPLAT